MHVYVMCYSTQPSGGFKSTNKKFVLAVPEFSCIFILIAISIVNNFYKYKILRVSR